MKKNVKKITSTLLTLLLLLSIIPLNGLIQVEAATTDSGKVNDTINWSYNDGTLTISGSGEMPNYKTVNYYYEGIVSDAPWGEYLSSITSVSISGTITNIGDCAFSDCPLLSTISMPSTIKVIGSNSFARCSKLEKVVFPNSLTEIGQSAFIGCSRIEEISIPDTVTSIKGGAFQACSSLKTVKLSSSLTSISGSLFQQCSRLNGVTIPSSVTEIGSTAFYNCSALTEMIIPQSVTRIYDEAFSNCSSITEMNIPESVTHLHSRAFQNCTSLKKITINNKSTSFFYDVFKNCNKLTVYGYTDSTTEKYCEENGYAFSALDADSSELDIKTFEIDKKSGQKIGTKITLSAKATGGSSPYKYLFYYKDADENEKSISGYSNSNNTEFTLTTVGTFSFGVRVKDNTGKTIEKQLDNYQVLGFTGFAGGDGSKNNPYLISDVAMFLEIENKPNACYKLTNNIDISHFKRISKFSGVFDGNSHTITTGLSETKGLFDTIEENGIITNLRANIGNIKDFSLPENYGTICINNNGLITKCNISGSLSTSNYGGKISAVGGVASKNQGIIDRCRNSCSIRINNSITSAGFKFGGICGWNIYKNSSKGLIKNCLVDGMIHLDYTPVDERYYGIPCWYTTYIGGICGYVGDIDASECIKNCTINTFLDFYYGDADYCESIKLSYGIIAGNEWNTYAKGLANELNSVLGCAINKDCIMNIKFDYCYFDEITSGIVDNHKHSIYDSMTYNNTNIKNITFKSSNEISEWWNNLLKEDPENPDPSTFEFSLSGKNYFILNKDGNLNLGYQSAVDGQVLSELKNIKWTNSNPEVATVSGLDNGIADQSNNRVTVMATVKALDVGSTTIEGTSPDGRKASFTINVEPEIKANSGKTISNETDLAVFTVTLNKPNKSFLQSFMNGIRPSYEFKDGLASFDVSSPTVSIGDDGLSATLNYHLIPQWGGNITFSAESISGQKIKCLVNSGLDRYPNQKINYSLDIEWGKDNFSFENKISDLPLIRLDNGDYNYNMDYSLFNHLEFLPSDILAMKNNLQPCGGVCFGMSVMAFKNATNQLNINSLQSGKSTLYQLSKPKDTETENLRNAIGLYQASCASSKYHNAVDKFINLSTHDKLSILYNKLINIEDTKRPVVLDYAWISDEAKHSNNEETGVSAHAVLAYGIENEYAPYEINGKRYEYKVWIINPNNSFDSNTDIETASQYCMYLDGDLDEFCIPVGGTRTDSESYYSLTSTTNGEMNRLGDAILQFATDDYNLLPSTTSDIGNNAVLTVSNQAAVINGNLISGYNGNDSSIVARSFTPCGQGASMNLTINKNNLPEVKTVSNNQTIGYVSDKTAAYITANKNSIVKFDDESIDLKNTNGTYQIELAINDSKFNDIFLSGTGNQSDVNVEIITQGLLISGDNLDGMTIESNTDSITLDTDKDSVAINEINNKLVVLEDVAVGDVNLDGKVSISDATEVQKYLAEFIEFNDTQKKIADANGDSSISISDATEIQKYLAEYIDHFNQPSAIKLNTNEITLNVGDTHSLSATISPTDVTNKSITWTSSDSDIATISNGTITAKSPGTAKITAKTYNGKTAKCTVTVKQIEPISVSLNKNTLSLNEGDSYQLSATVNPSNATNKTITWGTNNPAIATVDSNGKVKGNASGSATITATTYNGKKAYCTITVISTSPTSIAPDHWSYYLTVGETTQIIPIIKPDNAKTTVSWNSSDNSIATVNSSGIVTAISEGTATITLTTDNGLSERCGVIVKKISIGSFYDYIYHDLVVLSKMYKQPQGLIVGKDDDVFINNYKDRYTRENDPTKFSEFNKTLVIAKNTLTVRANQNDYIGFYRTMFENRSLDAKVYNSVVQHQVDAFYDACEASYYYTYFATGDIEFSDFESRYKQSVDKQRNDQKLALYGMLDDMYSSKLDLLNKEIYYNGDNSVYKGLKSKIENAKTKSDVEALVLYFEKNFCK